MSKKISILLVDDWELRGNGLGNVAHLQYLPSLYLMNAAKELQIKLTFMVEVMQQLAFIENVNKDGNIKLQKILWEENVMLMKDKGFDVQLHIHPHWYKAVYKDGYFLVNDNWNLATYHKDDQKSIICESIRYLNSLIMQVDKNYCITSFKAGAWALQPSKDILENLRDNGIKIIMGVVEGMRFRSDNFEVDYTDLEEGKYPFYPDFNDITRLSARCEDLFIMPTYSCKLRSIDKINRVGNKLRKVLLHKRKVDDRVFCCYTGIPDYIKAMAPMKEEVPKYRKYFGDYFTHIDLSSTNTQEFKYLIDSSMDFAEGADGEVFPILIESHTKLYEGNYESIKRKLEYVVKKYGGKIAFQTMTEFLGEARNNRVKIRKKDELKVYD